MKNEPVRSITSQVIIGVVVITIGIGFLLDNMRIFEFSDAISFWPVMFILFGCIKLAERDSGGGNLVGAGLVGLGLLMILRNLGYIDLRMRDVWPVLIIFAGAALVYKSVSRSRGAGALKSGDSSDDIIDATAILGGFERRVTSTNFRGGEVTALMGGCDLDLRGCSMEGEAVVNVFAAMGGISLKVPPDWTVIMRGTPILGGFEEKTVTPPNDSKRLIIKGYAVMGGVDVRN